ncbi:hypothetical protein CYLTODRAFT_421990 [Cylindrobasidium torrendii FP15055 ss-10]|uniref:Family A G protein-coupled receptor-like protein n=1 Tax=Cylindrobasidium torrendii FP15055 ss-10 TaxID=1314674 RepID=A0A0D7BEM3_9AGAR|nr:hypothetical protein CYLTODRAFT_421990 [Cylindrobasidium torrendii FP15055 ss-10]
MSTTLTAEDQYLLDYSGRMYMHGIVGIICESVWWAIYLVLFIYATRLQLSHGLRTIPAIVMFAVTLILFASSTSLLGMNATWLMTQLNGMLIDYPDLALWDRVSKTNERLAQFGVPMEALFLTNMIIGDSVVIWRAWALWQGGGRMRWLLAAPISFLCVSFGFMVQALKCLSDGAFGQSTIPDGGRLCAWSEPISWGISLLTNISSTTLIAIKAWQARRFFKDTSMGHRKTTSERILILLVESGFIYCLFWLSQVILFFEFDYTNSRMFAYDILGTLGDQLSGLYPTIIIVLVNKHRSLSNDVCPSFHVESEHRGGSDELPTIQFGEGLKTTTYQPDSTMGATSLGMTLSTTTSRESELV